VSTQVLFVRKGAQDSRAAAGELKSPAAVRVFGSLLPEVLGSQFPVLSSVAAINQFYPALAFADWGWDAAFGGPAGDPARAGGLRWAGSGAAATCSTVLRPGNSGPPGRARAAVSAGVVV